MLARIQRYLKHHYRDVTAFAYLLMVYPQMIDRPQVADDATAFSGLGILWLLLSVAGLVATMIKLQSLDPAIAEHKLQSEVSAPAQRFLAGFIALPLMITMPLALMLGPSAIDSRWMGPTQLGLGVATWLLLLRFGRGKSTAVTSRKKTRIATIALVLFELHLYTIFLETLAMADEGFQVSMRSLLVLLLPMTVLYFLLFLPATIGFYIEETIRYRSRAVAAGMLWLKFAGYRFLPVYFITYLEGRGVRVPWIL